jgi:PAS domain S-box-containing protein
MSRVSVLRFQPRRRIGRYLLALAFVAAATLLRLTADPFIHDEIPYVVYVAAVAVSTWFCGVEGGVLSTVVGAFTCNYLFVPPRREFVPHADDALAMTLFAAVALGLVWQVGRWRRAERDVRDLHAETAVVLEQMRAATLAAEVGVWTWLPGTGSISASANWHTLFGASYDEPVTFETWVRAVHPDDRARAIANLNAAWQEKREFITEYRVVRPDGNVRWIVDRGRAFSDATGQQGVAGINVDITGRKIAEQALENAGRLKDEFLATLSHELRTPLNAIVGWADMLRRGTLQADQAMRATESVYRNARTLSEMIDDVLDVSRIISGKVRIELAPVELAGVLRDAIESVGAAAAAKGIEIVTQFDTIPFPVSGDPTRLQQVFWNLLSNAVKFTPGGGRIQVRLESSAEHVTVRVKDTGAGIDPDFLPHVFERFRQSDSSTTRRHAGLGLGLAIVRHLVELHGGTVSAESPGEGLGTTFTVVLPAQPFEERRRVGRHAVRRVQAAKSLEDDLPDLSGTRVLVVDDEAEAREVTDAVLRHHGAQVGLAASAAEALEQFDSFRPDVLLVDLGMPEIDGYELIGRLRRSSSRGAAVPAIAFTAYARDQDRRRALASGFQMHLAKPVDSHTLVTAVASMCPQPR